MKKSIWILWIFLAILSCSKEEDVIVAEKGKITSFLFSEHDNFTALLSDVACSVDGNVIQGRIPHYLKDKKLIPTVTFYGPGKIVLRGQENSDTHQPTDFSKEVVYDIVNETTGEIENSYVVHITSYTGLPVINVYTEDNTEIDSKDVYKEATICCDFNNPDHPEYSFENAKVNIRGRGNSTWDLMPKKPYKLKFDKKTRLFGESEGKQWVLLANYADKSALRNAIAFKLSELSDLAWTPCSHFVELFINDKYRGNYQLTEQIKIAKDRVNLPEGGMILEIDHPTRIAADDVFFTTDKLLFVIKDPDVSVGSDDYNWAKDRLNSIEHILFSDSWLAERGGYKEYIDIKSFADWYLVNEICKNKDSNFFLSCFLTIVPSEKLMMGPVWDFDLAMGNYDWSDYMQPEGLWTRNCDWFNRLFEDPAFVSLVRERFAYFKSKMPEIYEFINKQALYLGDSMVENNNLWGTLYNVTWPNYAVRGNYQNEVVYLKTFLEKRIAWMNTNL